MKRIKFKIKTIKPTGRYRSFYNNEYLIKYGKNIVGNVENIEKNNKFIIRLMVIKNDINEDNNTNCIWRWVRLKNEFNSLENTLNWLNENVDKIIKTFNLFYN